MTSPKNRLFLDLEPGKGSIAITGREAAARYPDPVFFMRASPSMTMDEVRAVLRRNADEASRVTNMLRYNSQCKSKGPIIYACNKLHDFRVSLDIHGGEMGRPYLWEV